MNTHRKTILSQAAFATAAALALVLVACVEEQPAGERLQSYVVDEQAELIEGEVIGTDGLPIAGAQVVLLQNDATETVTTDAAGRFVIEGEPGPYRLTVAAEGYQSFFWRLGATDRDDDLSLTLAPIEQMGTFDAATGAVLAQDGGTVVLPADAFVDARGDRVSGTIEYHLSVASPAVAGDLDAVPWMEDIQTVGVINAEFYANGELVNLADGATAEIVVSLDGLPVDGDTLDLFYYDESLFSWVEEGTATVEQSEDGPVLRGQVEHFSAHAAGGRVKWTVCHAPPGNRMNMHNITIGMPALAAHIMHGDPIGECDTLLDITDSCDGTTSIRACTSADDSDACAAYQAMLDNHWGWLARLREVLFTGDLASQLDAEAGAPYCDATSPDEGGGSSNAGDDDSGDDSDSGDDDNGSGDDDSGSGAGGEDGCTEHQILINGVCYNLSDL
jgi:hypothetical protein